MLYEANGYRLNKTTLRLEQAGLISLDGQPKQSYITINGKVSASSLPVRFQKIFPGQYTILVSHDGYNSWAKTVKIEGGQAYENKKVYLYLSNITAAETTRNITLENITNDAQSQKSSVQILNNEIWYKEKLVTRFGLSPAEAILTDDHTHIMFQLGQELRVMDLDGTNNIKLLDFSSSDSHIFALDSTNVLFSDNGKIMEARIR